MRRTANIVNELNKFVYLRRSHAAKPMTSLCDRVHLYSKLQFLIAFTIFMFRGLTRHEATPDTHNEGRGAS